MRSSLVLASIAALAFLAIRATAPAAIPATAAPSRQESTPIVNPPPPTPHPIYAPYVNKLFDPLSPEPVGSTAIGWLAVLQPNGRAACAPATHVLLRFPEGTANNVVEAVVAPASPQLTLDLFVGDYVTLNGGIDIASDACRFLTWRILYATRARSAEPPPP
ncbi:MAG: hypothetical protein ABI780_07660 [Ardenticatenales bacterium]